MWDVDKSVERVENFIVDLIYTQILAYDRRTGYRVIHRVFSVFTSG